MYDVCHHVCIRVHLPGPVGFVPNGNAVIRVQNTNCLRPLRFILLALCFLLLFLFLAAFLPFSCFGGWFQYPKAFRVCFLQSR